MSGPAGRPGGDVVVVGSANVDYVLRVARRPEAGETVGDAVLEVHPGGKGANQALAAATCGAAVSLVARVGDDALGKARLAELAAGGVAVGHVLSTPGVATGVAFITLTPDGQNAITVAPGANARLGAVDVAAAAATIGSAAVLVTQLEIPLATVTAAAQAAGEGTLVVLNCAPARRLPAALLERVDVLVANEGEAALVAGRQLAGVDEALEAALAIRSLGPRAAVVTLGPLGAVAVSGAGGLAVPAPAVAVLDTTGAGDAFVGALAALLAAGAELGEAVAFGVAVGSATTESVGAAARLPAGLQRRAGPASRGGR